MIIRNLIRCFIACLLMALLMVVANYMDQGRYERKSPQTAVETTLAAAEKEPTEQMTEVVTEAVPEEEETVSQETEPQETAPEKQEQENIVLTFVGDCTFGSISNLYYAQSGFAKTVGEDYRYPFKNVISYMEEDDFTFLNLVSPLANKGDPEGERFVFRGDASFVNILTQNSVEAVSLANKHTRDYGEMGYETTCRVLEDAQIPYVENDGNQLITLDNGMTIGLYAAMSGNISANQVADQIGQLKQQGADVIIFAPYWGLENSYTVIEAQRKLAHRAIDAGAHIVYGTHPHVLQPIETYKDGIIYYSMGNFSFGGNAAPKDMDTALIQQEVIRQENGTYALGAHTIVPCSMSSDRKVNNYQPTPYEPGSAGYERVLKKLNGA